MRPRILWEELDEPAATLWTPGWLPDTATLRWSLTNSLRVEGTCDGWRDSYAAADSAELVNGYVVETELGDVVEVADASSAGRPTRQATLARLRLDEVDDD